MGGGGRTEAPASRDRRRIGRIVPRHPRPRLQRRLDVSISYYKRYVTCPECRNEIIAHNLMLHFRRAHKKKLSPAKLAEILSQITREPTRKPNLLHDPQKYFVALKIRQKEQIERKMKMFQKQTPFSMRQWGDDRPHRTGPI